MSGSKGKKPTATVPGGAKKGKASTAGKGGDANAKPEVPAFDAGLTTKDTIYRDRIMRAVEGDKEHPVHHGIKMQAHHLISATGMHNSGLGPKIKKFGYDINELRNLALLPCTLQGACHLGIQPHRGNHTAVVEDERYRDDEHPKDYHDMVKDRLRGAQLGLTKECPGYLGGAREAEARMKVKHELDVMSANILMLIAKNPRMAPLTRLALHFQKGNPVGCGGVDSTTKHLTSHHCMVGRNHFQRQGADQRAEKITYQATERYLLKVGR
jgi:hypothetical protein